MGKLNFSNFGLQGVEQMSRDEMKTVFGGDMPINLLANCSGTCADGSSVEITNCRGTCKCTDNVGCECSGAETLKKPCEAQAT